LYFDRFTDPALPTKSLLRTQQNILANTGIDICAANRLHACLKVESVCFLLAHLQALHWDSEEILLNQWLLSSRMAKTSQLRSHIIFWRKQN